MGTYNRIKEVRTKKHISQAELASMLDTSQSALAAYENGRKTPKLETLSRIAAALDVSVLALLPVSQTVLSYPLRKNAHCLLPCPI